MGVAIITFVMRFLLRNNSFSPAVSEVQFCGSVKDGNYPIPQICTGYVSCLGGITRHKLCPSGTLFNPLKKFCDLPVNVRGFAGKGSHSEKEPCGRITSR